MLKKSISIILIALVMITTNGIQLPAYAQMVDHLPIPGTMVTPSEAFSPIMLKGLKVYPDQPFKFDFILDPGQAKLSSPKASIGDSQQEQLKQQTNTLIKYFLTALTVPEKDMWVNLSPYEKDRIVPQALSETLMGRDMLAQDYLLKQFTASMIHPDRDLGKAFWDRVYQQAHAKYGTTHIPVNTFNKVWIVADKANVFERNNAAFITGAHLKVMMEEDYTATIKNQLSSSKAFVGDPDLSKQIMKDLILPAIEKEVNEGKNFAPLRQMFYSMILASWYKQALKESIIAQTYANKSRVNNKLSSPSVSMEDPEKIYQRYLQAYKKGVFNFIKEEPLQEMTSEGNASNPMPRKYFSGGVGIEAGKVIQRSEKVTPETRKALGNNDTAMLSLGVTLTPFIEQVKTYPVITILSVIAVAGTFSLIVKASKSWSNKKIIKLTADYKELLRKQLIMTNDSEKIPRNQSINNTRIRLVKEMKKAGHANGFIRRHFESNVYIELREEGTRTTGQTSRIINAQVKQLLDELNRKVGELKEEPIVLDPIISSFWVSDFFSPTFDDALRGRFLELFPEESVEINYLGDSKSSDSRNQYNYARYYAALRLLRHKVSLQSQYPTQLPGKVSTLYVSIAPDRLSPKKVDGVLEQFTDEVSLVFSNLKSNSFFQDVEFMWDSRGVLIGVKSKPKEGQSAEDAIKQLATRLDRWIENQMQACIQSKPIRNITISTQLRASLDAIKSTDDYLSLKSRLEISSEIEQLIAEFVDVNTIVIESPWLKESLKAIRRQQGEDNVDRLLQLMATEDAEIKYMPKLENAGRVTPLSVLERRWIQLLKFVLRYHDEKVKALSILQAKAARRGGALTQRSLISPSITGFPNPAGGISIRDEIENEYEEELKGEVKSNDEKISIKPDRVGESQYNRIVSFIPTVLTLSIRGREHVFSIKDDGSINLNGRGEPVQVTFEDSSKRSIQLNLAFVKEYRGHGFWRIQVSEAQWQEIKRVLDSKDPAMKTEQIDQRRETFRNPGGIDLNRAQMQMNVTRASGSDQAMVNVPSEMLQQLQSSDFQGFDFTINSMTPIPSVLPILGVNPQELQLAR